MTFTNTEQSLIESPVPVHIKPLKLSEAMRLGAMLKPQTFKMRFSDDGGSCALGAVRDAVESDDAYWELFEALPKSIGCPICCRDSGFSYILVHMNDDHRWTRERIANWVETLEL